MVSPLQEACRLDRVADGVYTRHCDQRWFGWESLHGGYVLALAIAAFEAELGHDGMELHSTSLQYLRPFTEGAFRAEVTVQRRGRTMGSASATLWSEDRLAAQAMASFAVGHTEASFAALSAPDVAPVEPDEAPLRFHAEVPAFEHLTLHPRFGPTEQPGAVTAGGWVVPTAAEVINHRWLGLLVDIWPPPAYAMWTQPVMTRSVDTTYHPRAVLPREELPPGSPLLVRATTKASLAGFVDEDVEVWSAAGVLLALNRQTRMLQVAGRR